jgi:hypothetical protein
VGRILPVKYDTGDPAQPGLITAASTVPAVGAPGVAFVVNPNTTAGSRIMNEGEIDLWVKLLCDFVIDEKERAVDGEFVRGQLPTGDRAKGSKVGIQGGLFESWFSKKQGPGIIFGPAGENLSGGATGGGSIVGGATTPSRVNINRATRDELLQVPGIGPSTADRIVAERPFRDADDFQQRVGPNAASWERMREHITVRRGEE